MEDKKQSFYSRVMGRSIFKMLFGNFFEVKNNTAGIIAIALVLTLCFVVIKKIELITNLDKVLEGILNVIFVVVGYYFGSKQASTTKENEDE